MDLDTLLAEAAPARRLPLDAPDSPAAERLYQRITQQPAAARQALRRSRVTMSALAGVAAVAVAAAVALALGSPAPARHPSHGATLTAWTVTPERHGLIKVTIRQLRDPAGLQRTLRAAGVLANVRFTHHFFQGPSTHLPQGCSEPRLPHHAIIKLLENIEADNVPYVPAGVAFFLRPSVIPHGLGLYLKAWAPQPGTRSAASLSIATDLIQATPQCTG
jgi:hypothetical protein